MLKPTAVVATHRVIRLTRIDEAIAKLVPSFPALLRFVPLHRHYEGDRGIQVTRSETHFKLQRSDYMQWHVFANLPEASPSVAMRYIAPRSVVLDVGANIGAFCLKVGVQCIKKNLDVKVIAFEPNPSVFNLLKENLNLNPILNDTVVLEPLALGREDGELELRVNPENSGGGSFVGSDSFSSVTRVPVSTIDDYVEENAITHLSFIKIDVEGYEPNVLLGASRTLEKLKPILYLEMTNAWFQKLGFDNSSLLELLNEAGYNCFRVGSDQKDDPLRPGPNLNSISQFDLLAIPEQTAFAP